MKRLLIIDSNRAEVANNLLVEEFGSYAANTFSVEVEDESKSKKMIACWEMDSKKYNRFKAKFYRRVACDTYTGGLKKMKELKIKNTNGVKVEKPKDSKVTSLKQK